MSPRYKRVHISKRQNLFEQLEARHLLAGASFGTNPLQPLDVTRDGSVTAVDALRVINALNRARGSSADPANNVGSFIDVTGEGEGTALDALRIINALNRESPLIAATLPKDSAPADRVDLALDLLTNDYSIDLNVSVSDLGDRSVRMRFDNGGAFFDITDQFTEGTAQLTEEEIDGYFGGAFPDGDHPITVQIGQDGSAINFVLTVDRSGPVPQPTFADIVRVAPDRLDVNFNEPIATSDIEPSAFTLRRVGGEGIPTTSERTATGFRLNLLSRLEDAEFEFTFDGTVIDLAGNISSAVTRTFTVADPTGIESISPSDGERQVNVTRETIIHFDEPVDSTTVTTDSIKVLAAGQSVPGRIRVNRTGRTATFFYDSPLPASTAVSVMVDGDLIRGLDGLPLDANADNEPGGSSRGTFRTLPLTLIPGTEVFGYVKDSQTQVPLAGVVISLEAFPQIRATTDETGFFELGTQDRDNDGISDGLPAPDFFVYIDGSFAIAPDGSSHAYLGKPFHSIPGQRTQLEMAGEPFDIYLPPIPLDARTPIRQGEETVFGFGDDSLEDLGTMFPAVDPTMFATMQVTIPADAAINANGQVATQAFVVPVDPNFLPAPLPANLNPALVVSIQAPGTENFDVPASVTFPNLDGSLPGEQVLLFSFDHDAGRFVVNGTATVSEDGLSVSSDPGVGINAPGWHFVQSGSRKRFKPRNPPSTNFNPRPDPGCNANCQYEVTISVGASIPFDPFTLGFDTTQTLPASVFQDQPGGQSISFDSEFEFPTRSEPLEFSIERTFLVPDSVIQAFPGGSVNLPGIDFNAELVGDFDIDGQLNVTAGQTQVSVSNLSARTQNSEVSGAFQIESSPLCMLPLGVGAFICGVHETPTFSATGGPISLVDRSVPLAVEPIADFLQQLDFIQALQGSSTFKIDPVVSIRSGASPVETNGSGEQVLVNDGVGSGEEVDSPGVSFETSLSSQGTLYYRFDLGAGRELSGQVGAGQEISEVLPANQRFSLYVYAPNTNRSIIFAGETGLSGELTQQTIELDQIGGFDFDRDGLPNVGEFVIGTDATRADTDSDGVSDTAEIAQGLDPLGGRAFPTGSIASLALLGESRELVVTGSIEESNRLTAFVATGSHGMAIVDVSEFANPILLSQIDLPGENIDLAVDTRLNLAAVAGRGGLKIVDISDRSQPELLETLDVLADQVVVADGIIYALNGLQIQGIDLVSRTPLFSVSLDDETGQDISLDGDRLYVLTNESLRVFQRNPIDITPLGQITVPGFIPLLDLVRRLFVADDLAYVGYFGYSVIDVSDPSAPVIVGSLSEQQVFIHNLTANGSGLLLPVTTFDHRGLSLYDSTDPTNVSQFITSFDTPGDARSAAIAAGVALVADDGGGLSVVNYLNFDNGQQPPEIEQLLIPETLDVNANESGIQVSEGSRIDVPIKVTDDVQVRNVELLVDGQVVQNAVSFPFNLSFFVPRILEGTDSGQIQFQVRATDTGGNIALTAPVTLDVRQDSLAPQINQFDNDAIDVDQAKPGVQILAGTSQRILFAVNDDDGDLANVALIRNGQTIEVQNRRAGSFVLVEPTLDVAESSRMVELQLQVTDRVGNVTTSDRISYEVVADTFAPTLAQINLTEGESRSTGLFTMRIQFSEAMDESTLGANAFQLLGPNSQPITSQAMQVVGNDTVTVQYDLTDVGQYELTLNAVAITDLAGNALGASNQRIAFSVEDENEIIFPAERFDAGDRPESLATADFDGDGIIDIVAANQFQFAGGSSSGSVSVLLGRGNGTFKTPQTFVVPTPKSAIVGDFNGDGAIDLATANGLSNSLSVLLGNGDGTFQVQQELSTGTNPTAIAAADYNGDGSLDLATSNADSNDVTIRLGNGDGTFQTQQQVSAGSSPSFVIAGDLNRDGRVDLVVANRASNDLSVLIGNGDGTFAEQQRFATGSRPRSIALGDFDNDQNVDIATANENENTVSVLLSIGDGTYVAHERLIVGDNPSSVIANDINDDGFLDLVAADGFGSSVILGNGDGSFQDHLSDGLGQSAVTAADFNGDGRLDLAGIRDNFRNTAMTVLLGKGDGTFSTANRIRTGESGTIDSADFNADGVLDLVVANKFAGTVSLRLGVGDGTFAEALSYDLGTRLFDMALADFNGDGALDVVTANEDADMISVLLGNGDGSLLSPTNIEILEGPNALAAGDFNRDGLMDIAVVNRASKEVAILLGDGDGTFQESERYDVGTNPQSIETTDVNGDGFLDLFVANGNTDDISVFLGNGNGTFQEQPKIDAGDGPYSIVLTDLSTDGSVDLAFVNGGTGELWVLLGRGDGTFGSPQVLDGGAGRIVAGDFNGDGKLDIASDFVELFLGNGDGTFQGNRVFSAFGLSVVEGDFNGDGRLDLATAGSNGISILLNLLEG